MKTSECDGRDLNPHVPDPSRAFPLSVTRLGYLLAGVSSRSSRDTAALQCCACRQAHAAVTKTLSMATNH